MLTVDLNADLGESYGIYALGADEQLLPSVLQNGVFG
ncbi:LamB/YcsF family protein [Alicyclobacillus hesperidum]|uniref:LamB/YcsF family protein n=1 Tax=Alicyclobacillus hesperidum TaxID=89784 RepID=A0A1H2VSD9_9BACL|nr:LamB/YcsF family protein [Alicyclobacillus hesperidum]SDW71186.1 LamB/YcsF family protein [Alicyclobacillus hesperidum]